LKNAIYYYYHLLINNISQNGRNYSFQIENDYYIFFLYTRPLEDADFLYNLTLYLVNQNPYFPYIVLNFEGKVLTYVNNRPYFLVKSRWFSEQKITFNDLLSNVFVLNEKVKEIGTLLRINWIELWKKKIDYIEYQIVHLKEKYPILWESVDYYIGMGENAISYIDQSKEVAKSNLDLLVLSHRRIDVENSIFDYYNPLLYVIDHRARDISEYLKSLFLSDHYSQLELQKYFQKLELSPYGYHLLLARMLFPSIYFDKYEQIVNDQLKEEEILKIIERANEYEQYLYEIFQCIKDRVAIIEIPWLLNKK